jgi:hypothetical protein
MMSPRQYRLVSYLLCADHTLPCQVGHYTAFCLTDIAENRIHHNEDLVLSRSSSFLDKPLLNQHNQAHTFQGSIFFGERTVK